MQLLCQVSILLLAGAAAVEAELPMNFRSANPIYGLMRRQDGYKPEETTCGSGFDCAAACGEHYIQCDSTDGNRHCYDPTAKKETCCPNGSGNSCRDGFSCTQDSAGETWCCPDGVDLVTCAKQYQLTDTLVSQTVTATLATNDNGTGTPTASSSNTLTDMTAASATETSGTLTDMSVTSPAVDPTYTSPSLNGTYTNSTSSSTSTKCTKSCDETQKPSSSVSVVVTAPPSPKPTVPLSAGTMGFAVGGLHALALVAVGAFIAL